MNRRKNQRKNQLDRDKSKALWIAARVSIAAILGFILIFFFGNAAIALVAHYRVSACNDLYKDRELEILSYRWEANDTSDSPKRIRGVIHPEGIEVVTDDDSVSLMSLNGSDSLIQMTPPEDSVIGKKIKVKYFLSNAEDHRWWHPATVHNHIQFTNGALIRIWAFTIGYLGAMLTCFVYAYRTNRKYAHLFTHLSGDDS